MHEIDQKAAKDKRFVALTSVFAAIFLTGMKLIVGLLTGSLGILSEALHSALDLVAAVMTLFAVKIADKPADKDHTYGHGKIENISALGETILLLITCIWIIYEAFSRLISGNTHVEVNIWSFIVIIASIIIDFSRSRALMKAAKKYNSAALEADALHFSTDILSSAVVFLGLIGTYFNYYFFDAISGLAVAIIVIHISYKLGRKSIDDLMDRTSPELITLIESLAVAIPEIYQVHDIRARNSGALVLIELNIHVHDNLTIKVAHEIAHKYEDIIKANIEKCHVHVHIEPHNTETAREKNLPITE
jgi:cation diffusion facilitator family transporter